MRRAALLLIAAGVAAAPAAAQKPFDDFREALALLPVQARAGAQLIRLYADHEETVREGTNEYICVSDLPGNRGYTAGCYHRSLNPMLARERELVRKGNDGPTIRATITREVKEGRIRMPERAHQTTVSGPLKDDGDPGELTVWHFLYMPFVESDDIGMTEARDAESYLHNAGTYDAHAMWSDSPVTYGTRSAEPSYLTVRIGEQSKVVALGDTIRLTVGDTATLDAHLYDDAGNRRDPSALWWHDTAQGLLRFLRPKTGGRYAADPARVIAATAGSDAMMLHWAGTAGGAVLVAFRVDGS